MIRYARARDHALIAEVVTEAFGRADEADLVARLRADDDVLFELVSADADGGVGGHVLFSRLWGDRPALFAALAPLAVRPGLQGGGVGSALVRAGIEALREFGAHGVLVLGEPAYYGRFGFTREAAVLVESPYARLAAFQALAIEEGAFDAPLSVAYPDAFAA